MYMQIYRHKYRYRPTEIDMDIDRHIQIDTFPRQEPNSEITGKNYKITKTTLEVVKIFKRYV